tara:strand:+ start:3213 stop:3452 length:240 start_codon:yes stop_codon:yes gene_type:complete
MRALYLELLRMTLNTIICFFVFLAGIELDSIYLEIIGAIMWISKLVASMERRTTWNATKKRGYYREQFKEGTDEEKTNE